jgi:hypothetical protein
MTDHRKRPRDPNQLDEKGSGYNTFRRDSGDAYFSIPVDLQTGLREYFPLVEPNNEVVEKADRLCGDK